MELLWEIAGWTGAVSILGAHWSVSMGWLKAGHRFQTANLVGSCAFIVNGTFHGAWPTVATNIAWFLISAAALLRMSSPPTSHVTATTPRLQVQFPGLPDTICQSAESEVAAAALIDDDVSDRFPGPGPK